VPNKRSTIVALGAVLAAAAGAVTIAGDDDAQRTDRQTRIAERGAQVMPFDLDKTTHRFKATARGGVQAVVAKHPADHRQIVEIRGHLRAEAAAFARGDLSDPASIHGERMPGLQVLEANADALDVRYLERSDGAEVRFRSDAPMVVRALHRWFDAQLSDHGSHAIRSG